MMGQWPRCANGCTRASAGRARAHAEWPINVCHWPAAARKSRQSASALPSQFRHIGLFYYCKCVIDLYSEMADPTLHFCMPSKSSPQITGAALDERRLDSKKRMCANT
jgi:hypothetical protein